MKQMKTLALTNILFATLLASFSTGCVYRSKHMLESAGRLSLTPTAGRATVVFLRPGHRGANELILMDQNGRWLGELWRNEYTSVQIPAGRHTFYKWDDANHHDLLKANLEAGKVYYVLLRSWGGSIFSLVAGTDMEVLSPRQPKAWARLNEWLAKLTPKKANLRRGNADFREKVAKRIQKAEATFARYAPKKRALHYIRPDDGTEPR